MAVSSTPPRKQYTATAGQTDFMVPWKWFADEDNKAYSTEAGEAPAEPRDDLVLNVDYSLAGTGDENGGTLTLVTAAELNQTITIERDSIGDRPESYDFKITGTFTGEQLNKNFDKLSMGMQDNHMLIHNRMLLYPAVDTFTQEGDLILPKLENGYIWKKSDSGKLIAAKLEEGVNCSTLRSELLSQTFGTSGTSIIGHYAQQLASGEPLETFLNRIDLILRTDLAIDTEADSGSKLIGHYDEEGSLSTTVYDQLQILSSRETRIPFWGFRLKTSLIHVNNITISVGTCVERGGEEIIKLTSSMIKRADANWTEGTGNGGMASTVTYQANKWYYIFVISKADRTTDVGYDSSIIATNLLADAAGYTHYKRVGSFITKSNGDIMQFFETISGATKNITFTDLDRRADSEIEFNIENPPAGSPHTITLKHTPHDISVIAKLIVQDGNYIGGGGVCAYELYSDIVPQQTGQTAQQDKSDKPWADTGVADGSESTLLTEIPTNGTIFSSNFAAEGTPDTDNKFKIWSNGWVDNLDMDEFV